MSDKPILVWTEIPVTDMTRAVAFYNAVFDWDMQIDESGPNPMAILGGAMNTSGGHLYPGTPGQGPTVHLAIPGALQDASDRATANGATLVGDPVTIPAGSFQYINDPDGNSVGLFQAA